MDIVVKGRHCEVSERFRGHVAEKLAKVEKLDPKVIRVDVEVSKEHNPRQADLSERIELTCVSRGPVIRAEAAADDKYAALDLAWSRLEGRLRKAAGRRRVHHGSRTPKSVASATAAVIKSTGQNRSEATDVDVSLAADDTRAGPAGGTASGSPDAGLSADGAPAGAPRVADGIVSAAREAPDEQLDGSGAESTTGPIKVDGDGPLVVREKTHEAKPITLDQALYEMELVGHDFYLFVDARTSQPSVVYRRRGYDYGVIRLAMSDSPLGAAAE